MGSSVRRSNGSWLVARGSWLVMMIPQPIEDQQIHDVRVLLMKEVPRIGDTTKNDTCREVLCYRQLLKHITGNAAISFARER